MTMLRPGTFHAFARLAALAAGLGCLLSTPASYAQTGSSLQPAVADLAVTYAASHSVHTGSENDFWLQGGAVEFDVRFFRGLGLTVSGIGLQVSSTNPQVAPLDLVTIVFGPRYTFLAKRRISAFGEVLAGEAHGFNSLFAYGSGPTSNPANGTTTSADSLALQTGGGVDVRLNRRFAIRAIQLDYLRTQLPNGGTNVQNNFRLAAGLDFRFGH